MISVITATHRRPDLLYRCIKAVQNNTYQNYEHMIVADRCEYAESVVNFVNDPRITLLYTPQSRPNNVGAVAKNIGIAAAKNDFVCYCDDDNILLPNALQSFIDALSQSLDYVVSRHFVDHINIGDGSTKDILSRVFTSNSVEISRDDMLVYAHTKQIADKIGPWMPYSHPDFQSIMDPVGGNSVSEDGEYIRRLNAATKNMKCIDDITAIYYARNACQVKDLEYERLLDKFE